MADPVTTNSIGRLAQSIRSIFTRLDPVETKTAIHGEEIDRLKKVAESHGKELEAKNRQLMGLTRKVDDLQGAVDERRQEIKALGSILHGEKIKRGKAAARASRAEAALKKRR